ncbi:sialate O-acetylesterase [Novosphingobium sp. 17-62-19]|uniref:sialate O-acetylesterase n=1 Tax=Novosphingobium sp. 17-62-19 TaxID=1970406 RepID=UPI0025DDADA4|nr:sialate O-acetylesterase [Novosphingobium sp. 17-62-19]HQS95865.1 sialate O-acetylesterase [Novosphingobium sp.]
MRSVATLAAVLLAGAMPVWAATPLEIGAVWTDHAVVQRGQPVLVEGRAGPSQVVSGQLGDELVTAKADRQGRFALRFAPRAASADPVSLTVSASGARITRSDLLVGDVWFCSGQSNMEYPLHSALNGEGETASANDPQLRLLQVPRGLAYTPQTRFPGETVWAAATPQSARDFSAACYFMARELRRARGVPIGAIHASWGGSKVTPWLDPEAGSAIAGAQDMALLAQFERDPLAAVTQFTPRWQAWYAQQTGGTQPWALPDGLAWQAVPSIAGWQAWTGTPLAANAIGTVWLRRQVTLSADQARAGAKLSLGVLDDMDMTFVNGQAVGNTFGWDEERVYKVPPAMLREGVNEVMVAVTNTYANGGFASAPEKLAWQVEGGALMPLAQDWRFAIAPVQGDPPRAPWDANAGVGLMHNRMVAPLGHFAMEGAAWYQGESDIGTADYARRMQALVAGWRARFGSTLKVAIVQLANYGSPATEPAPSGWAQMRDGQRRIAAADGNAALVTAIDIGERTDIHPANKLLLGQRLAMVAQGKTLPAPRSAKLEGNRVRVRFSGVQGGLQAWSAAGPIGFEICTADNACRHATALVDGDSVVIAGADGKDAQVRYAWADSPVVNLFDERALPVPGFMLAIER